MDIPHAIRLEGWTLHIGLPKIIRKDIKHRNNGDLAASFKLLHVSIGHLPIVPHLVPCGLF